MTALHELTALQQGAAIATGEATSRELVEHALARTRALNAALGAFITVTDDAALDAADEVDRTVRAGERLGPLAGVPTAIKDLVPVAGIRTTYGSAALSEFVPRSDAHVVTRMKDAGLISIGKTNTAEFGLTPYTSTIVGGSARTPWDLTCTAGGSSGGSAAAVAAELVPIAHGNDGGGSLRIPAAACGVVGLKPSRGRIGNGPAADDPTLLLCQGPLARTVADAAALLDAMAGGHPTDPYAAAPSEGTFLEATNRAPGTLRIAAWSATPYAAQIDGPVQDAFSTTLAQLEALGHRVTVIDSPFGPEGLDAFITTWAVRALRIPLPAAAEENLLPITRWWRDRGRSLTAGQFLDALVTLAASARTALEAMAPYDVVLTPSLALRPQPEEWFTAVDAEELLTRSNSFSPYAAAFSVTGQPSISLPLHTDPAGLPIGMLLSGRPGEEARLLSLAAQLEAAHPWAHRRPAPAVLSNP